MLSSCALCWSDNAIKILAANDRSLRDRSVECGGRCPLLLFPAGDSPDASDDGGAEEEEVSDESGGKVGDDEGEFLEAIECIEC